MAFQLDWHLTRTHKPVIPKLWRLTNTHTHLCIESSICSWCVYSGCSGCSAWICMFGVILTLTCMLTCRMLWLQFARIFFLLLFISNAFFEHTIDQWDCATNHIEILIRDLLMHRVCAYRSSFVSFLFFFFINRLLEMHAITPEVHTMRAHR